MERTHRYNVGYVHDADPAANSRTRTGLRSEPARGLGERSQPFQRAGPHGELEPARPGVGVLRITLTSSPGLLVRLGQERETATGVRL